MRVRAADSARRRAQPVFTGTGTDRFGTDRTFPAVLLTHRFLTRELPCNLE